MIKRYPLMKRSFTALFFLFMCVAAALAPADATSQTLERISANERSDGKGFVVRYHLTELADSFRVVQPAADRIQMKLYSNDLDTLNLRLPPESETFPQIDLHKTEQGIGVDIFLGEEIFFRTNVYPDQNGQHLLLALEYNDPSSLTEIIADAEPMVWGEDATPELQDAETDDRFLRLRDNLEFRTVVLDAGHGGHDAGATGVNGILEKDVALAVTLKVGEYIKRYLPEVEVVYTRDTDEYVTRSERGLIATRNRADLFVSIHANSVANASSAHGTETFFLGMARTESALEVMKRENSMVDPETGYAPELTEEELMIYELTNSGNMALSERLASMIEDQFENRVSRRSRGVKQAGLEVLWHASTPAVLVELGFLSNPNEARFLSSEHGQVLMASAIFRAIRDYKVEYERSLRGNNRSQARN